MMPNSEARKRLTESTPAKDEIAAVLPMHTDPLFTEDQINARINQVLEDLARQFEKVTAVSTYYRDWAAGVVREARVSDG